MISIQPSGMWSGWDKNQNLSIKLRHIKTKLWSLVSNHRHESEGFYINLSHLIHFGFHASIQLFTWLLPVFLSHPSFYMPYPMTPLEL